MLVLSLRDEINRNVYVQEIIPSTRLMERHSAGAGWWRNVAAVDDS